ncbi:MAG: phosphoglucosamine mutase [Planctomycetota bacterium]
MTRPELTCVCSVSGLRGITGESLDPVSVTALATAFASSIAGGGPVVLGRDSRRTGPMFAAAATAGLCAGGCTVIDLGLVPTPTVPLMVRELGATGGIQISASHNPGEWNALKFYSRRARNIDQRELDQLLAAYAQGSLTECRTWEETGVPGTHPHALDQHRRAVCACVDSATLRRRRLRVLVDSVNGAGSVLAPVLLADLGCEVIPVHTVPDLPFPRDPEPTAQNVTTTCAMVTAAGADIGFVQDPDADRLAIIDNTGRYIGEEYTLVLCAAARFRAAGTSGPPVACTNLSTSRMIDDIAARFGGSVIRTPVGEAHVLDALDAHDAVIGGEGNGGVIDPRVVACRDSQVAMALVLEYLAGLDHPLSAEIDTLPRYAIHKEKVALSREAVAAAIPTLQAADFAQGADIDTRDGIRFAWDDRWVHLRASGTEPASRIIAEAPSAAAAQDLAATIRTATDAQPIRGH